MSAISQRQHAAWARALIKACGGLEEAAGVCRLGKSQLGRCEDPLDANVLPIDVLVDLEFYCGQAIYSSAVAGVVMALRDEREERNIVAAACAASEAASDLQRAARRAMANQVLNEAERRELTGRVQIARRDLDDVLALLARDGGEL